MTQHKFEPSDSVEVEEVTENRKPASIPSSRRLLNLQAGDRRGLARAFQALVGRPPEVAYELALETLEQLGFSRHENGFSHPLAPDRLVAFNLPEQDKTSPDPEAAALKWAIRHFREIEFYLPYISLTAKRQRKQAAHAGLKRQLPPEPDYDEDGFLTSEL